MSTVRVLVVGTVLAAAVPRAEGSELAYTFVEFGTVRADSSFSATKNPLPTQRVDIQTSNGPGLSTSASLAIARRFYVAGSYESVSIDVDALVVSPLARVTTNGDFDLVTTRGAFGIYHPIGDELDVFAELTYTNVDYDFGSFAGESFDVNDGGVGFGAGVRWNPLPALELFANVQSLPVADVDLSASQLDSGTQTSVGARLIVFGDLNLGIDFRSADVDKITLSLRFGFGDLNAGR